VLRAISVTAKFRLPSPSSSVISSSGVRRVCYLCSVVATSGRSGADRLPPVVVVHGVATSVVTAALLEAGLRPLSVTSAATVRVPVPVPVEPLSPPLPGLGGV
jgi:hypothetical protein